MFTIDTFLEAKEVGGPYAGRKGSPTAIRNYRTALKGAERLMEKPLADFTEEDGQEFLHKAHKRQYHQATINQMLAALKGAFSWAIGTKKYSGPNPFAHIMSTTIHREIPTILTMEQMQTLFECIHKTGGQKYTLIFSLMGFSGLRINEALSLKKKNVIDDGIIIIGKGNKPAYVPVKPALLKALKEYIKTHPQTDYVFYADVLPKGHTDHLKTPTAYEQFYKAASLCELPTNITPHTLRHSFATHALHKTKRLEIVQDLLRHADPKTTRFYAQVSPDELKKEASKLW